MGAHASLRAVREHPTRALAAAGISQAGMPAPRTEGCVRFRKRLET